MKEISVEVNQRSYALTTDPSAEREVREAVGVIDRHASDLADSLGFVPESTLLLLAGIQALSESSESAAQNEAAMGEAAQTVRDVAARMRSLASRIGA